MVRWKIADGSKYQRQKILVVNSDPEKKARFNQSIYHSCKSKNKKVQGRVSLASFFLV